MDGGGRKLLICTGMLAGVVGEKGGELLLQGGNFGDVADLEVGVRGVLHGVVLVVVFAAVKGD